MEPFELLYIRSELESQLDFLIVFELKGYWINVKRPLIKLIVFNSLVGIVWLLPDTQRTIMAKSVLLFLLGLVWVAAILYSIWFGKMYFDRVRWKRRTLRHMDASDEKYLVSFTNEGIRFLHKQYETYLKWTYYKYYILNGDTIFILVNDNPYEATYFSSSEIGASNYAELKQIVSSQLEHFQRP